MPQIQWMLNTSFPSGAGILVCARRKVPQPAPQEKLWALSVSLSSFPSEQGLTYVTLDVSDSTEKGLGMPAAGSPRLRPTHLSPWLFLRLPFHCHPGIVPSKSLKLAVACGTLNTP